MSKSKKGDLVTITARVPLNTRMDLRSFAEANKQSPSQMIVEMVKNYKALGDPDRKPEEYWERRIRTLEDRGKEYRKMIEVFKSSLEEKDDRLRELKEKSETYLSTLRAKYNAAEEVRIDALNRIERYEVVIAALVEKIQRLEVPEDYDPES